MLHRIVGQAGDLILFAFLSFAFGIIRCFALPEPTLGLRHQVGSVIVSVLVGTITGALCMQWAFGDYTSLAASSIGSLLSRDIVMAILRNRAILTDLLRQGMFNTMNRVTGGNAVPAPPPAGEPGSKENPL